MDDTHRSSQPARLPAWLDGRWVAALLFALAVIARLLPGPRTIDDSFITYRYARNLLAGEGFVYNPGERVLGTTTPLYTTLMAFGGLLTGGVDAPFARNSLVLNAFADGATCLLLLALGRRLGCPFAGLAAALAWVVAPFSVTFAVGGLETSVYVLLLVGITYAHLDNRHGWVAGLAALAYLTRPDALILVGLVGIDRLAQLGRALRSHAWDRAITRTVLVEAAAFGLPVLAWTIFATVYFGSPLPHSMAAKAVAYRLGPEEGLVRLLQHYGTPFMEHLTFSTAVLAVTLPAYLFLYIAGAWPAVRRAPKIWSLAAYPWLYLVVFAAANPLIFRWYLTPPLPAYFLFILAGAERLVGAIFNRFAGGRSGAPSAAWFAQAALGGLLILVPAGLSLRSWQLHPDHGLAGPAPDMAWYQLELLYRQAAGELASEIGAASAMPTLAAGDVGVLGFFSGARILDTVGLNSPVSTGYYPIDAGLYAINYAIPPALILDQQPQYLVILEVYGRLGLLKDPRFWEQYELRSKIPTDIYGSDGMLIFEHK